MRMRNMVAVAAALALGGCGGGEEQRADTADGNATAEMAAALADGVQPRPGQYQTTMEILDLTMPGMPQAQVDQMRTLAAGSMSGSSSFCLTPEDAAQGPERMVQEMTEADCRVDRFDQSGGTITAEMQCTSAEGMQGRYQLEGQMTAESSTMNMRIDQSIPGMPGAGSGMQMEMRVTSQRTGDCV